MSDPDPAPSKLLSLEPRRPAPATSGAIVIVLLGIVASITAATPPGQPETNLRVTLTSFTWLCARLNASDPAWTEHRFAADGALTTLLGDTVVATGQWQVSGPRMVRVQHRSANVPLFLKFDSAYTTFEALDGQGILRGYRGTRKTAVPAAPVVASITVPGAMAGPQAGPRGRR